jgi:hypothetical protein
MSSRSKRLKFIIAIIALMMVSSFAYSATEVVVDGFGDNRATALLDAQRSAVATVVGQVVDSKTLVKNYSLVSDRILTSSQGYLKTFQVVEEGASAGGYRVRIRAVVETVSIKDDINAIAVLSASKGNPRFIIVPDPNPGSGMYSANDPVVDQAQRGITEYMSSRQLKVIQAPAYNVATGLTSPSALKDLSVWGAGLGAEYVIYYSVEGFEEASGRTFKKSSAVVNITAVHTGSYEIVAEVNGRALGSDKNAKMAARKAGRTAGENTAGKAVDLVLANWSRSGTTAGTTVNLIINNIDGTELQAFENGLQDGGDINLATRRTYSDKSAVIAITLDGGPSELAEAVGSVLSNNDWSWALTASDSNSLTYSVPEIIAEDIE